MRYAIITTVFILVYHHTFSQELLDEKISISFSQNEIAESLIELQTVSQWRFSYNPDAIPKGTITKTYNEISLGLILNELLGKGFEYKIRGSYLIIQHSHPKQELQKKPVEISGQIVDAKTGKKIGNVSVYEVNDLTAALSKPDGSYHLSTFTYEPYTVLAISKEHYRDTLIRVSQNVKTPISLSLEPIRKTESELDVAQDQSQLQARFSKFIKNSDAKQHERNVALEEERVAQISFLPVLGTNGLLGGKVSNKTSLNIIAGYSYGTNGAEIGGVLNMNRKDMKGTQVAGVSNIVGERMSGAQIAGVSNTNFTYGSGAQIAGVTNSSGAFHGVQVAGTYNYVKHLMSGWQVSGSVNYAGELSGVQLGVINIAKKVDKGVMIGIFNIALENGLFRIELDHTDLTHYNIYIKSGTNAFYSLFTAGISPQGTNQLWSYGMGFGSQLEPGEKFYMGLEATSNTIQPLERHISGLTIDNRLSFSFGYKLFEHLSINAGPVVHYYLFSNRRPHNNEFYNEIGFKPFAQNSTQKAWVGYRLGVRF